MCIDILIGNRHYLIPGNRFPIHTKEPYPLLAAEELSDSHLVESAEKIVRFMQEGGSLQGVQPELIRRHLLYEMASSTGEYLELARQGRARHAYLKKSLNAIDEGKEHLVDPRFFLISLMSSPDTYQCITSEKVLFFALKHCTNGAEFAGTFQRAITLQNLIETNRIFIRLFKRHLAGDRISTCGLHLPLDMSPWKELTSLDLKGYGIDSIPDSFWMLRNLKHLDLSWNKIAPLSPKIIFLQKLRTLGLEKCGCKELPPLPAKTRVLI